MYEPQLDCQVPMTILPGDGAGEREGGGGEGGSGNWPLTTVSSTELT